jgi:hypothetical protein
MEQKTCPQESWILWYLYEHPAGATMLELYDVAKKAGKVVEMNDIIRSLNAMDKFGYFVIDPAAPKWRLASDTWLALTELFRYVNL